MTNYEAALAAQALSLAARYDALMEYRRQGGFVGMYEATLLKAQVEALRKEIERVQEQ